MRRWRYAIGFFLALLLIPVSCRQLFTTSLASSLARTSITISSTATVSELLELATSSAGTTPEGAKAILAALASHSDEIAALSAEEKTEILNLAITAAINMESITTTLSSALSGTDENETTATMLSSFDSSVDITAVMVILSDTSATDSISAETLVYAGAIVLADAADSAGSTTAVMDAVSSGDTSGLSETAQAEVEAVIALSDDLTTNRSDELETLTIGGYNVGTLIEGTL